MQSSMYSFIKIVFIIISCFKGSILSSANQALLSAGSSSINQTATNLSTPVMLTLMALLGIQYSDPFVSVFPALGLPCLGAPFLFYADGTQIYINSSPPSFIDTVGIIFNASLFITWRGFSLVS